MKVIFSKGCPNFDESRMNEVAKCKPVNDQVIDDFMERMDKVTTRLYYLILIIVAGVIMLWFKHSFHSIMNILIIGLLFIFASLLFALIIHYVVNDVMLKYIVHKEFDKENAALLSEFNTLKELMTCYEKMARINVNQYEDEEVSMLLKENCFAKYLNEICSKDMVNFKVIDDEWDKVIKRMEAISNEVG